MINNGVIFRTERLLVRKLTLADLPAFRAVEGNKRVMQYITGRPRTPAESEARLKDIIERYNEKPLSGIWAVIEQENMQYVGTASLFTLPECPYLQIGFKLKPSAQGKGYATEIARHLLHYSFFKAKLKRVVAVTHLQNKASQHVLKKIGMEEKGFHRAYDMTLRFFSLEKEQYLEHLAKKG